MPPDLFDPARAVGRDGELDQLEQVIISRPPLVVVVGPRGVGKTTIARDLAQRLQERGWDVTGPGRSADVLDGIDAKRAAVTDRSLQRDSDAAAGSMRVAERAIAPTAPADREPATPRLALLDDYTPNAAIDTRLQSNLFENLFDDRQAASDTFVLFTRHAPPPTALGAYRRFDLQPIDIEPLTDHLERLGRRIEPVATAGEVQAWAEVLVADIALIPDLVQALRLVRQTG